MNTKTRYATKQKSALLDFFRSAGGHATAADICAYLEERGSRVSLATVYRQLDRLVGEGLIGKFTIDSGTPACYEYLGAHDEQGAESCFHLKCGTCGRLIHLHCDEISDMREYLRSEHGFYWNPLGTVFYGECAECRTTREDGRISGDSGPDR